MSCRLTSSSSSATAFLLLFLLLLLLPLMLLPFVSGSEDWDSLSEGDAAFTAETLALVAGAATAAASEEIAQGAVREAVTSLDPRFQLLMQLMLPLQPTPPADTL